MQLYGFFCLLVIFAFWTDAAIKAINGELGPAILSIFTPFIALGLLTLSLFGGDS